MQETQILSPNPAHKYQEGISLRPFVEATLENGDFVRFELPSQSKDEPSSLDLYVDETSREWSDPESALEAGSFCVRELPDKPQVHFIEAENSEEVPVYLPAGLAFVGGAQNRMVLESRLLRKGRSHIPVYCIEAGRWGDPPSTPFCGLRRIPDLLLLRFLAEEAAFDLELQAQFHKNQIRYWELVLETLNLSALDNPSMNLLHEWEATENQKPESKETQEWPFKTALPQKARGYCYHDERSALSLLRIRPGLSHLKANLAHLWHEMRFRKRLRTQAAGARRYFRIFDEEKKIAIQCDRTGAPYKTLRKRPVLFPYTKSDLQNSFVPPIEPAPPPPELDFSRVGTRASVKPADCLTILSECEGRLQRFGTDLYRVRFSHPERLVQGTGTIHSGRLADLDMILYEPDAAALQN